MDQLAVDFITPLESLYPGVWTAILISVKYEIEQQRKDAVKEWTEQMVFLLSALDLTITLLKEIRDGKPQSSPLSEKIELVEDIMRKKGNKAFGVSDEDRGSNE